MIDRQPSYVHLLSIAFFMLVNILVVVGCTNDDLSTGLSAQEAEKIIAEKLSTQPVLAYFDIQKLEHKSLLRNFMDSLMPLQNEGLITYQEFESQEDPDYFYVLINMTEKAEKYAMGVKKVYENSIFMEVKSCEKKVLKVTEIQPRESSETKWAIASYEWRYGNPTPFAYLSPHCQEKGLIHTGDYTFTFDNGSWEIGEPVIGF